MGKKQFDINENFGLAITAQQISQSVMKINLFSGVPACDIKYVWLTVHLEFKYHAHTAKQLQIKLPPPTRIIYRIIHPNTLLAACRKACKILISLFYLPMNTSKTNKLYYLS